MKKLITLSLLISIAFQLQAQLLWKISGNGLEKPSYIIGTHHLIPLSFKDSIAGLPQALDATTQVYGEVVMSEMMSPAFMQTMQQAMILPGDTTLQHLFTPEEYETIGQVVKEHLMVDLAMLNKLKPAALTQQISVMLCMKDIPNFNPQELFDLYFQQQALQNNKKVGGLETPQSQLDLFFKRASLQRQATLLTCLATNTERAMEQHRRLLALYKAQDLKGALALMEERDNTSCDPIPGEMEAMLDNRNQAWVKIMPDIMQEAPTLFVVGAGHLPGANGVLTLLEKSGYTVEPVN